MRTWPLPLCLALALCTPACTEAGDSFLTYEETGTTDAGGGDTEPSGGGYEFTADILPIFEAHGCLSGGCHGSGSATVGLSLETLDGALAGGSHGAGIVPCDADASIIIAKVSESPPFGSRMPIGANDPLSAADISVLVEWVEQGADTEDCSGGTGGGTVPEGEYDFTDDILPLLDEHGCTAQFCHGNGSSASGLSLDTLEGALAGGGHGPAVVPCDPDGSPMYTKTSDSPPFGTVMPLGADYAPLDDEERALLAAWIAEGADTEACSDDGGGVTDEPDVGDGGGADDAGGGGDTFADDAGPVSDDVPPADDAGAGSDISEDDAGPAPAATWDDDIKPILDGYGCTWSGCHTGSVSSGLSLETLDDALAGGLNGAAVSPCDTPGSVMLDKIGGSPSFGSPMPLGGDPVSAADLETIQDWILSGADTEVCD